MKRHLFRFLSAILPLLLMKNDGIAQNGAYDVRFQVKDVQCADRNVTVELQVKAHSATAHFVMGDANYRFEYDPRNLRNPRIVSQPNFSSQAPARNANYGIQNLNGSKTNAGGTAGIVSLNTFYTGSEEGGQQVPNTWTTVAEIRFDWINTDSCIQLKWHDNNTFPITGMSEVAIIAKQPFDYNLYLTQAGGVFENLNVCPAAQCNCIDKVAPNLRNDYDTIAITSTLRRNVLANDSLVAGAKRTVRLVTQPNAGILLMQPDGTIAYTPSPSFTGTATYSYEVCYEGCANLCKTGLGFITIRDARRVVSGGIPNIITPNGDGLNDYLVIDDIDPNNNHTELVIYNQWGDLVFKANPYKNDWGGHFKNQPLPDGTYYYIFTREQGETPTAGFITIFR
jgi:gliding motility-associated-like protein